MREGAETFHKTSTSSEVNLYEGVLIKLRYSEDIFYVKGISHPPGKVIAFPRYVIKNGKIVRNLKTYREQIEYAQEKYGHLLKKVNDKYILEIPVEHIEKILDPVKRAQEISQKPQSPDEEIIAEFLDILYNCIDKNYVGVVGSRLLGVTGQEHDVDIVILDSENALTLYEHLTYLKKVKRKHFNIPNSALFRLYESHKDSLRISFEIYREVVERRVLEGYYRGIQYFMRILLMRKRRPLMSTISARKLRTNFSIVVDFNRKIYTTALTCPCIYTDSEIYIVTERGVFTETLKILGKSLVCGDLEEVVVALPEGSRVMRWIYLGPSSWVSPV